MRWVVAAIGEKACLLCWEGGFFLRTYCWQMQKKKPSSRLLVLLTSAAEEELQNKEEEEIKEESLILAHPYLISLLDSLVVLLTSNTTLLLHQVLHGNCLNIKPMINRKLNRKRRQIVDDE